MGKRQISAARHKETKRRQQCRRFACQQYKKCHGRRGASSAAIVVRTHRDAFMRAVLRGYTDSGSSFVFRVVRSLIPTQRFSYREETPYGKADYYYDVRDYNDHRPYRHGISRYFVVHRVGIHHGVEYIPLPPPHVKRLSIDSPPYRRFYFRFCGFSAQNAFNMKKGGEIASLILPLCSLCAVRPLPQPRRHERICPSAAHGAADGAGYLPLT